MGKSVEDNESQEESLERKIVKFIDSLRSKNDSAQCIAIAAYALCIMVGLNGSTYLELVDYISKVWDTVPGSRERDK